MRERTGVAPWKKWFRVIGILVAGWIAYGISGKMLAQATHPTYSIAIDAEKSTVKLGDDVIILIKLKNISNSVLPCTQAYEGNSNVSYRYDVKDDNGRSMKKQDIHPELMPGDVKLCSLDPGEIQRDRELISWRYDFSKPGRYTVQVARPIDDDPKDNVKSNILTITVAP